MPYLDAGFTSKQTAEARILQLLNLYLTPDVYPHILCDSKSHEIAG